MTYMPMPAPRQKVQCDSCGVFTHEGSDDHKDWGIVEYRDRHGFVRRDYCPAHKKHKLETVRNSFPYWRDHRAAETA